jgi:hypothetical protein
VAHPPCSIKIKLLHRYGCDLGGISPTSMIFLARSL